MKFNVKISATEYCGFEEDYEVEADDYSAAEDIAEEKHLQDFIDAMGLIATGENCEYIELEDMDDYEEDPESVHPTTINFHAIEAGDE